MKAWGQDFHLSWNNGKLALFSFAGVALDTDDVTASDLSNDIGKFFLGLSKVRKTSKTSINYDPFFYYQKF